MSRLIFGSCSSQHYPEQPFWPVIQNRNATAFVWAGDAVYADDRYMKDGFRKKVLDATPEHLRNLFDEQRQQPGYNALLQSNISIFGTIDDHDYGTNNGDNTFRWRRENTFEFVRFLDLDKDSAMFQRAKRGKGVYGVQVFDFNRPPGNRLLTDQESGLDPDETAEMSNLNINNTISASDKLVAVFVLDIRTNRSPWRTTIPERFQRDTDGDFLGKDQWEWFETAIGRSNAAVNIVVNGLQVHPERFFEPNLVENWSGFRRSQHRLYQTLLKANVQAPIIISGDVHKAQLMRKDCVKTNAVEKDNIRPIYEITTSGMTHSWGTKVCGRANANPLCYSYYHNTMFRLLLHFAHWLNPWTEILVDEMDATLQYSLAMNVAELEFDWKHKSLDLNILGVSGDSLLHQRFSYKELTNISKTGVRVDEFGAMRQQLEESSLLSENDWVCVHHRGTPNSTQLAIGAVTPFLLALFFGTLPAIIPLIVGLRIAKRCFRKKQSDRGHAMRAKKNKDV